MMQLPNPFAATVATFAVIICGGMALARTWTDSTGKYKIEGEFVWLADGQVDIRRDDGKLVRIPLEKLSEADQQRVRKSAKSADESPFAVTSDDSEPSFKAKLSAAGSDTQTQTVFAEGVGTTKEEALKDAFRAAVRQVVGEVVDGETLVKNEELVKDQVLTYSDGFIPEHKVTSEKRDNGLFRVGIRAKVQRRGVIMKLKSANIAIKEVDGQSLGGLIESRREAQQNALALLRHELEGCPEDQVQVRLDGKPKLVEADERNEAGREVLQIDLELSVDRNAYTIFSEKLQKTLHAIALEKGEFSAIFKSDTSAYYTGRNNNRVSYGYLGCDLRSIKEWMPRSFEESEENGDWNRKWRQDRFTVAVNTHVTQAGDRMEWKYYLLDTQASEVFGKLAERIGTCKLTLLDAADEIVAVDRFPAASDTHAFYFPGSLVTLVGHNSSNLTYEVQLMHGSRPGDRVYKPGIRAALIAPVLFERGRNPNIGLGHKSTVTIARKIKLSQQEISKVAKAKCELQFE
jgi:hypothetical protein